MNSKQNPLPASTYFIRKEEDEQASLFHWARAFSSKYPQLTVLYAVPNAGKRGPVARNHMLRTGLQAGVPDVCLPVPRGGYGALYIELKVGDNKPTEKQAAWIKSLAREGNYVAVCYSWEEARNVILGYLSLRREGRDDAKLT
jgi:VRR-NUC domain